MSQERLVSTETEIEVRARGTSPSDAISKAFAQLRSNVYERVPGPIVHMEPIGVNIEKTQIRRYTERFLGVLWPKERQDVELTVKIRVAVRYISLDGLE